MRPFKFFFVLSLGVLLLFFIGRFVLMALIAAAVLSLGFFIFQKARYFFTRLSWRLPYRMDEHDYPSLLTESRSDDVPFFDFDSSAAEQNDWKVIKIH